MTSRLANLSDQGTQLMQTRLHENFTFGITDPTFNAVCVNDNGDPQALPSIINPDNCANAGFAPNRIYSLDCRHTT